MSGESWKPLTAREWKRRLDAARTLAVRRLAVSGLDGDHDAQGVANIAALILEEETGRALHPALGATQADVEASIKALGDPQNENLNHQNNRLSEQVFAYAMAIAEASFLFGVIAGCHLSWPVVEATPAPCAPPRAKGGGK